MTLSVKAKIKDFDSSSKIKTKAREKLDAFRKFMMWNFFLMFFYEAALEIMISLVIGYKYTNEY